MGSVPVPGLGVGDGHVLLSEWAGRYPSVNGSPLAMGASLLHRSPCPVCGHPTGDCTDDVPLTETP